MEKIDFTKNKNEQGDEFTLKALEFLKGKMSKIEAENFANEFLDNQEKLEILLDIKHDLDKVKETGVEYGEMKSTQKIKNLLKNIYGITLEN